jgi:hypothetical protein
MGSMIDLAEAGRITHTGVMTAPGDPRCRDKFTPDG